MFQRKQLSLGSHIQRSQENKYTKTHENEILQVERTSLLTIALGQTIGCMVWKGLILWNKICKVDVGIPIDFIGFEFLWEYKGTS